MRKRKYLIGARSPLPASRSPLRASPRAHSGQSLVVTRRQRKQDKKMPGPINSLSWT